MPNRLSEEKSPYLLQHATGICLLERRNMLLHVLSGNDAARGEGWQLCSVCVVLSHVSLCFLLCQRCQCQCHVFPQHRGGWEGYFSPPCCAAMLRRFLPGFRMQFLKWRAMQGRAVCGYRDGRWDASGRAQWANKQKEHTLPTPKAAQHKTGLECVSCRRPSNPVLCCSVAFAPSPGLFTRGSMLV